MGVLDPPEPAGPHGSEQSTVQTFLTTLEQLSELEKTRDELLCKLQELHREIDEKERSLLSIHLSGEEASLC